MAEKNLKFGERLHDKINQAGLNKKKVAERIGITPAAMGGYINEGRIPEAPILLKLSRLLNTTMEELLEGGGEKTPVSAGEGTSLVAETVHFYKTLSRILEERNKTKIAAVKAQLEALDPGEKKGE